MDKLRELIAKWNENAKGSSIAWAWRDRAADLEALLPALDSALGERQAQSSAVSNWGLSEYIPVLPPEPPIAPTERLRVLAEQLVFKHCYKDHFFGWRWNNLPSPTQFIFEIVDCVAAHEAQQAEHTKQAVAQARVDEAKLMRDEYVGGWCDRKAAEKHFADLERDLAAIAKESKWRPPRADMDAVGEMNRFNPKPHQINQPTVQPVSIQSALEDGIELVANMLAHVSHGGPTREDGEKWLEKARAASAKEPVK